MAYNSLPPLVAPNVFVLKLKIHCNKCENKLKRLLLTVQGVQSVSVDAKQGTVTISGTVDPSTVLMLLENLGRKADVLWEHKPANSTTTTTSSDDHGPAQSLEIVAQSSKVVDRHRFDDPEIVSQLQQLSGIKGLMNVEVAYSKTIKLTFKTQKDEENAQEDENVEITIKDGVRSSQIPHDVGGICAASVSCCGGHTHHVPHAKVHGSSLDHLPCSATHPCTCSMRWGPPPWTAGPSAPPLAFSNYDPPPPTPATGYPYSSPFSDENPHSCNIM